MLCVNIRARHVTLRRKTFWVASDRSLRLHLHETSPPGGRDGRLSFDDGRMAPFDFLGRARIRQGPMLGFLRIGRSPGGLFAFDTGDSEADPPVGNTGLGFDHLSAALPLDLPALVAGTRVATPDGMRPVERLRAGDRVVTRAGRSVRVLHALHRRIDPEATAFDPEARPVVVLAHSFGPDLPARDVCLSRRQRILLCGWRAERTDDLRGVLAPAGCLVDDRGVVHDTLGGTATLVQLVLESEAMLMAEGLPLEAAHPDGPGTRGYRSITERELAALEPSRRAAPLSALGRPARPPLTAWEVSAIERERREGPWSQALRLFGATPPEARPEPKSGPVVLPAAALVRS